MQNKKSAWAVLGLFLATCLFIVLVHSFILGVGFDLSRTISRYVGLSFWSVVLFIVSNSIIAAIWIYYIKSLSKNLNLSKAWLALSIFSMICLILLSLCPIDFYDSVPGEHGIISIMHQISSRTMFVAMIMTVFPLLKKVENKGFRIYCISYLIYSVVAALLFATNNAWFWSLALPFESLFIIGYLVIPCIIPENR